MWLQVRLIVASEVEQCLDWVAAFAALDLIASSAWTRVRLGWEPTGPDLRSGLAAMDDQMLVEARPTVVEPRLT